MSPTRCLMISTEAGVTTKTCHAPRGESDISSLWTHNGRDYKIDELEHFIIANGQSKLAQLSYPQGAQFPAGLMRAVFSDRCLSCGISLSFAWATRCCKMTHV